MYKTQKSTWQVGNITPMAVVLMAFGALAGCGSSREAPPTPAPVAQAAQPAPTPEPAPAPAPAPEHTYTLSGNATFNSGQAKLRPSADAQLDDIIAHAQGEEVGTVTVTGYTDSVGSHESNQELSLRRAQAVAHYLQEHGLKAHEYVIHGNGESDPVDSNDTEQGRAHNRRVEIDISG